MNEAIRSVLRGRDWGVKSRLIGKTLPELFAAAAKRKMLIGGSADLRAPAVGPRAEPGVDVAGESLAPMTTRQLESLVARLKKELQECEAQRFAAEERLVKSANRVAHLRAQIERLRPVQERVAEVNGRLAQLEEVLQEQARIIWVKDKMIEELMKPESRRRRSRLLMATRKLP